MKTNFEALILSNGSPIEGAPLGAILTGQASLTPERPALTIGTRTWTFMELEKAANTRARWLASRYGIAANDRVAITLPNCVEFIEVTFAVWKLGAIPCPVSWRMAQSEFSELMDLLAPRCIAGFDGTPEISNVLTYDVHQSMAPDIDASPLEACQCATGKIMNSGGSTGKPKLIVDPLPSVWSADKVGRRRMPRTIMLMPGPFYHSAPFSFATSAIMEGSHVVCSEKFDAEDWLRSAQRWRPAFAYLVPTMMSRIAKLPAETTDAADLSSIDTLYHTAAPCPPNIKRWWIERLGPEKIIEVYGGSERIGAAVIDGAQWLDHPGSVGQAAAGYEAIILGADGSILPPGEIGEIYFRNIASMEASYQYIGSETRQRNGMDSFGDMGWIDQEGWLYIADRRTDMIVVGGANIFPAEIEAKIETLAGVQGAAVIGLPDSDLGNALHAVVELHPDMDVPPDGIEFLKPALADISRLKHPRSVEFTRERIRDDAGKVRRSQLREQRIGGA